MRKTTFLTKPEEIVRGWKHFDAECKRLGRLATEVASILMGKHRPQYTPHIDTGEYVLITNAEKIVLTGNKAEQRTRTFYSTYAGGIRYETVAALQAKNPESVIETAVRRMLPKGRLGRQMISKLKVYKGTEHPHGAQQPVKIEL